MAITIAFYTHLLVLFQAKHMLQKGSIWQCMRGTGETILHPYNQLVTTQPFLGSFYHSQLLSTLLGILPA